MSLALALGFFIAESGGKPSCRFFKMLFTRLKKFPSLPWLLSVLIIKACCMLSNTLTVSMETIWRRQGHPTPVLLPGKIPWTEEPDGLQSMGSPRVGHDWATWLSLFPFMNWRRKWQSTPVFLPGESQGTGSLVGFHLCGRTESDTNEAT